VAATHDPVVPRGKPEAPEPEDIWQPPLEPYVMPQVQRDLWPDVSGNTVNGLGETAVRRPEPIYHHDPERTRFAALQTWFRGLPSHPVIGKARHDRIPIMAEPLAPLAPEQAQRTPAAWSAAIKAKARELGAELVGIAPMQPEWVFEGFEIEQRWAVMLGVAMDYEELSTAPHPRAIAEVVRQYGRGTQVAKRLASWLRTQGWDGLSHGGPEAGPVLMIPPALACGFGELGKHGSIINKDLGSSFRLAYVLTDVPLTADPAEDFGVDDFCTNCRVCEKACPPNALTPAKHKVRGATKWYVDFDKCVPYFNDTTGCGICIAVCPWSRPGVAPNLAAKLTRRRDRRGA
jgi:epoxyqueuosine reductase